MKVLDKTIDEANKLQTQNMNYIEKQLNLDPNNTYVKALKTCGQFMTGTGEGDVMWTAESVAGAAKTVNPLYWIYLGSQISDTGTSILNTPMWQKVLSEVQANPGDIGNNYRKLYVAGTVTEWNIISSFATSTYNEISQDPYKCGQFTTKTILNAATIAAGIGEATAASNAAKTDLAVASAENAANTAVSAEKIATSPVDDIMRAAASGSDDVMKVGASGAEVVEGAKLSDELATLYRSVGPEEYYSIMETGEFSVIPQGLQAKQFGLSLDQTIQFADKYPDLAAVIEVKLPQSELNRLGDFTQVDKFIFKDGTVTIQVNDLKEFNQAIQSIAYVY